MNVASLATVVTRSACLCITSVNTGVFIKRFLLETIRVREVAAQKLKDKETKTAFILFGDLPLSLKGVVSFNSELLTVP